RRRRKLSPHYSICGPFGAPMRMDFGKMRWRLAMKKTASRRRFLQDTAVAAAGSVLGASAVHGEEFRLAQGSASPPAEASNRGLPRIHLLVGPGTLPSMGKDRMDLIHYRLSGNPRLTGEQLIEPLPEIAKVARVDVDKTTSWGQGSYDDLRKLSLR